MKLYFLAQIEDSNENWPKHHSQPGIVCSQNKLGARECMATKSVVASHADPADPTYNSPWRKEDSTLCIEIESDDTKPTTEESYIKPIEDHTDWTQYFGEEQLNSDDLFYGFEKEGMIMPLFRNKSEKTPPYSLYKNFPEGIEWINADNDNDAIIKAKNLLNLD